MAKKQKLLLVVMITAVTLGCHPHQDHSLNDGFYQDIVIVSQIEANSYLVLVNKNNQLEPDYAPNDLVLLNVLDFSKNPNTTIYMRETAAHMVEQLFQAAADEANLLLLARSGYRSYQTQMQVYERYVAEQGQHEADQFSARPGHSEHQTGLALDVTADSVNGQLVKAFGETAEGKWLKNNTHRFGFMISYPQGREKETGYMYEPWHIRYVGKEAATEIYELGWILEEYLNNLGGG